MNELKNKVKLIVDELIAIRRDLHKYPEVGLNEYRTQEKICEYLKKENIMYMKVAKTGVMAVIGNTGPVIGIRADIDALPIQEEVEVPFTSVKPGVMHACGHDIHTVILLGVAKALKEIEATLKGRVKLLFEPAEETVGGAIQMIKEDCLKEPEVDGVIGLHVMPYLETGKVEIKHGHMNAASDTLEIIVEGKSGHAAYPENTIDSIVISSSIVMALQTLVSRNTSPLDSAVVSIGSITGGNQGNIISDKVVMRGTMRTLENKTRTFLKSKMQEIVSKQAESFGGRGIVNFKPGFDSLTNSPVIMSSIEKTFERVIGRENICVKKHPSLGVESFAFFANEVPSAFYHLGCKRPNETLINSLHSSKFDPDENCIELGVLLQVKAALDLMEVLK